MKRLLPLLVANIVCSILVAQQIELNWVEGIGGAGREKANACLLNNNSELVVAGVYEQTVDFDPSSQVDNHTSPVARQMFLQGLDENGSYLWLKKFEGNGSSNITSIVQDVQGNYYLTGNYSDSLDVDLSPSTSHYIYTVGVANTFILKLDENFNFTWVKMLWGDNSNSGNHIVLGDNGAIYVSGMCSGTNPTDFDPGLGNVNYTSNGLQDGYVLKLDAQGDYQWVRTFSGVGDNDVVGVEYSGGNLYVAGSFDGVMEIDTGSTSVQLTSQGSSDIFMAQLNTQGELQWANSIGSVQQDVCNSFAVDAIGNVYLTGRFQNMVDFDPDNGTYNMTSITNQNSMFLAKYEGNGHFLWASKVDLADGNEVQLTSDGDIIVLGGFTDSVAVNSGMLDTVYYENGAMDMLVMKFDSIGGLINASPFQSEALVRSMTCDVDQTNSLYVVGFYQEDVDYVQGNSSPVLNSNGLWDIFMAKFSFSDVPVSVKENMHQREITIYPNPGRDIITVMSEDKVRSIRVFDLTGALVMQSANQKRFDASQFKSGVYFIEIVSGTQTIVKKFVKE